MHRLLIVFFTYFFLFSCSNSKMNNDYSSTNKQHYNDESNSQNEDDEAILDDEQSSEEDEEGNLNSGTNEIQSNDDEETTFDGGYCAEVTYYNPKTGRQSNYTLTIEVDDNELEKINFPQGYLDNEHFGIEEFDSDGELSFTSDRGYNYTVKIIGKSSGCFDGVPRAYQCIGVTEDGSQCEHMTDNPSGYCWQHENQE